MKTTASTAQALERLAEATGYEITRDDKSYLVHIPGGSPDGPPLPKNSVKALAYLITCVERREDWEALRHRATRFDPGIDGSGRAKVSANLSVWEQDALRRLAITEITPR